MKVLIVDDETHVREAIKLLGNWEQHGVTELLEATDGQAAIELIEEANPSIVMTDMRMPRKDGTALMEWISRYSPQTKIIVISGYDDFELVRHAIRHGGIDYILKPVDPSALNDALSKAIDTINQEEMKRLLATRKNIEVNRMKPHYADKLFTDLVSGHGIQEVIVAQLQDEFGVPESINECTVAVISTAQLDMGLIHKFKLSHQLLYFTLTNICNEFLSSCNKGVAFHHLENPEEIVLLFWKEAYPIPSFLEEIRGGIDLALHRRVHFGLGSQQSSPKGIAKSYQEAHAYLWGRNLLEPSIWLHTKENATNTLHRPLRLSSIEEQLRTSALSGSLEQIGAVIQKWMNQVHELEVVTPDNLKQWNDEWDWMMKQWMATGEPTKNDHDKDALLEMPQSLPLDEQGRLSFPLWEEQYKGRLTAAGRMLTQQHTRENHIIHDIAHYLERHYAEDISLQDMATRFFFSREYISRRFKQEFSVNISDFLARIRIEKAKLLLLNPQLRISQIAEMVGYPDEKYFSKVFKKQEGRTPNEYRKEKTMS